MLTDPLEIAAALAEPFAAEALGWKPQTISGARALAVCFIDARDVMDRLDAAVGPANWSDDYTLLPNGTVVCQLSLRIGGEWVTKTDVGGESDQKDVGDREKAAFSDALKRAAVKWGVGRYIYSLPAVWCDYDPQKKQLKGTPALPAWALPKGQQTPAPAVRMPPQKAPAVPPPKTGEELEQRVYAFEARLAEQGLCGVGDLVNHLLRKGQAEAEPLPDRLKDWPPPSFATVMEECQEFARQRRQSRKQPA